jgi:DNA end-binding protein Ku
MLHRDDSSRIQFRRFCATEEKEVSRDEILKGYEFSKGQYVVLEDEDFEKLPLPSKHTIEIAAFVDAEDIPTTYHERAYYLEPQETGIKAYRLLLKALSQQNLVAIGKIAFRQREHLCALRPTEGILALETLFYADEVRPVPKVPEATVSERELDMAFALIDLLREPFQPDKFQDDYRVALRELIEAKQEGREIVEEPTRPETRVVDLMEALRASVEAAGRPGRTAAKADGKAKPTARSTTKKAAEAAEKASTRRARRKAS